MYKIIGGDGKEYGPVSEDQLRQWVSEGRANAQTRVQAEGSSDWVELGTVVELASRVSAPPAVAGGTPSAPAAPGVTVKVPNYLVPSILVTLCCCLPLGIPAIVFAAQVNSKLAAGDVAGAQESSRKAKMWCWIAFGLGLGVQLIYLVFYVVMIGAELGKM